MVAVSLEDSVCDRLPMVAAQFGVMDSAYVDSGHTGNMANVDSDRRARSLAEIYKLSSMENPGKIIVSMTSYPGRIQNVGMSIFLLLTQQTLPPDEIHLWLAIPQFPNIENDLPVDLRTVIKHPNVFVHWLPENTYVHKRHEIFKIVSPNDCVFLIDDDVKYADDLIERLCPPKVLLGWFSSLKMPQTA